MPVQGPSEQERDCEEMPCPIHCEWSEWTQWTECSEQCGPGRQMHERLIEVHASGERKP